MSLGVALGVALALCASLVCPAAGNPLGISHWDLEGANE